MTTPDPWRVLQAGEHAVFRNDYSLTLLADGPTPWGYLHVVPTVSDDERRVDWTLDDTTIASLRMTDLDFGRRTLSNLDYPVVIDPKHTAAVDIADATGTAALMEGPRTGLFRRRDAHIHITIGHHEWDGGLRKNWYSVQSNERVAAHVRQHAVQDATRPSNDRTDDWRHTHLLQWSDGVALAQVAVAHLLFSGSNWAVTSSRTGRAMVDGARKRYFEERAHLLDDPRER